MGDSVLYVSKQLGYGKGREIMLSPCVSHNDHRFLRAKRRNQTFCFLIHATDTIEILKDKIVDAANQHCGNDPANKISSDLLRIMKPDHTILEDSDELSTKLKNNDIVHVVLKISDSEYELVELESSAEMMIEATTEDPAATATS